MGKKPRNTQPRALSKGEQPRALEQTPATNPVAAFEAFGDKVTGQIDGIAETVKQTAERIELVDSRTREIEQSVDSKFDALRTDADGRFAEFAERLEGDRKLIENIDESVKRAEAMGGRPAQPERRLGNAFAQELATGKGMQQYLELAETDKRAAHRFAMKNGLPFRRAHGFAGESTVVIDDGLVGDGSDPVVRAGLTELIRDPIGLVDVINEVPTIQDTDTYKEMVEDLASELGFVVAAANGAQDGATTPQAFITVHNTEGFIVGQSVYIWADAAGRQGPFVIDSITAGTTIGFASAVVVVLVEDGSLVTGEEFAATPESSVKPAGVLSATLKSVDLQTMATYLIMTRQRLRRTNLFDLAAWAGQRLPFRLRENLEWHLLYGSGTAPQLHGFLNAAIITAEGVSTDTWSTDVPTGSNRADLLLWSAANIPGNRQLTAVMHKLDWHDLVTAKDTTNNYLHGAGEGPRIIDTPALKAVGGIRVVLSSRIAQTYALMLDPAQASSFVRLNDAEMLVGYVNDQLIQNQQTMLYEQSMAHLLKVASAWRRVYFDAAP